MKIMVSGSNGNLGRVIVPILLEQGHLVNSVGRSHNPLLFNHQNWSLDEVLSVREEFDYFFHLAFNYAHIDNFDKFVFDNVDSLRNMVIQNDWSSKIVVPLSLSGSNQSKSRYGQVKRMQESICREYGLKTITIGWLDVNRNGSPEIQAVIAILRKLSINVLPDGGLQPIHLSNHANIGNALESLFEGEDSVLAYDPHPISLKELIYGETSPKFSFFGGLVKFALIYIPKLYSLIPRKFVRVFDSARSLL